ncbi:MAG: uridine diphosphate-N-acetylglucosamine-binding protein YvcK [Deinococcales bacterium]|nr:uridine diphosphate-N-acetylglucosamine-binding protein YvcK [Deinococcales bacterium]
MKDRRSYFAYLASMRLWLTPGMGVKRHVLVAAIGIVVLLAGTIAGILWIFSGNRQILSEPIEVILVSKLWDAAGGWTALLIGLIGLATTTLAIARLNRSLLSNWMPDPYDAAVVLHRRLSLSRGPNIVAFGGGTGLSNLLRGLRNYTSNLTAVVTVSDDGGSSGRLRQAFDIPAPGDLTDCLAALSGNEQELGRLLSYRFQRGKELQGHTFGNLLITTLTEVRGDFGQALRTLNSLLDLQGAVYPASSEPISLLVEKPDSELILGETRARNHPGPIKTVSLRPHSPKSLPEVTSAITLANLIVLGPGSLFTSTLPPLLVPQIRESLHTTQAKIVYVLNIMTEAGETDGFEAFDHITSLKNHLGRYPDFAVINSSEVDLARQEAYSNEGATIVKFKASPFRSIGIETIVGNLLGAGPHAQHDSSALAEVLFDLARSLPNKPEKPIKNK